MPDRDAIYLRAGGEVKAGAAIVEKGERLLPGYLGLAAAAGISRVSVYRRPRVAIIGVGDEVVAPGGSCSRASFTPATWSPWRRGWLLSAFLLSSVVNDNEDAIKQELMQRARR